MNYVVIHRNQMNENAEVFGPFGNITDAKSWMAQEFNDAYEVAKKNSDDIKWNWNDERLGSCKIEGIGFWEVVKRSK